MAISDKRKESMYNYAKKNLKRIPLDVQKEKYEEIKAAATAAGESVNGYIKKAVDERMDIIARLNVFNMFFKSIFFQHPDKNRDIRRSNLISPFLF